MTTVIRWRTYKHDAIALCVVSAFKFPMTIRSFVQYFTYTPQIIVELCHYVVVLCFCFQCHASSRGGARAGGGNELSTKYATDSGTGATVMGGGGAGSNCCSIVRRNRFSLRLRLRCVLPMLLALIKSL